MPPRFQQFRTGSQPQGELEDPGTDGYRNGVPWAILPHVRATMSVDGAVLLDIEEGLCYSLNVVGAKIWQVLESGAGHATSKDVVNALAPQFNVPLDQLTQDVKEYLRDLEKKVLIKTAGSV